MNAIEYLSQAYRLDQQIQTKLQQISSLRALSGTLKPFTGNDPVSHTRNVTALEDTVIKIMEEEQALNEQIDRLVDLKKEIARTISQVDDVVYRLILEKRHLCFLMWEQIACEVNYSVRSVQTKYWEAIKVVERILAERDCEGSE
jgi:hypothetical protein